MGSWYLVCMFWSFIIFFYYLYLSFWLTVIINLNSKCQTANCLSLSPFSSSPPQPWRPATAPTLLSAPFLQLPPPLPTRQFPAKRKTLGKRKGFVRKISKMKKITLILKCATTHSRRKLFSSIWKTNSSTRSTYWSSMKNSCSQQKRGV